jgi:hypothetical protein
VTAVLTLTLGPSIIVALLGWRRAVVRARRSARANRALVTANAQLLTANDALDAANEHLDAANAALLVEVERKDSMLLAAWAELKDSAQLIRDQYQIVPAGQFWQQMRDWATWQRNTIEWMGDPERELLDERFASTLSALPDDDPLWDLDSEIGDHRD